MALSWGSGFSLIGPPGSQGVPGANGSTTRFGTGTPPNTLGADGDSFFAKDTQLLFYRSNGTYDAGTSLRGGMGINGVSGAFYTGAGAPTSATNSSNASANAIYIQTTGEVWTYTQSGGWVDSGESLQGPAGARGSMIYNGQSAPTSSNPAGAQSGDVYYQTSSDGTTLKVYFLTGS